MALALTSTCSRGSWWDPQLGMSQVTSLSVEPGSPWLPWFFSGSFSAASQDLLQTPTPGTASVVAQSSAEWGPLASGGPLTFPGRGSCLTALQLSSQLSFWVTLSHRPGVGWSEDTVLLPNMSRAAASLNYTWRTLPVNSRSYGL